MRPGQATIPDGIRAVFEGGATGLMTDGQLLDCFAGADPRAAEAAFAALVERHGPLVLGVCRRILADDHLAEDAWQATWLVLARRGGSIRDREVLGGWLHRVARRVATRAKIRASRWQRRERAGITEVAVLPENPTERREVQAVVDAEVDRLGDPFRLPILLCDLEGWTHEQAADHLCWPVGTVKSRLSRGRARLATRLARRGLAPSSTIPLGLLGLKVKLPAKLVAATAAHACRFASGMITGSATTAIVLAHQEIRAMLFARRLLPGSITAVTLAASGAFMLSGRADPPPILPPQASVAIAPGPAPTPSALTLSASGRVVDSAGRPIAGALVLIREWSSQRANEGPWSMEKQAVLMRGDPIADILGQTRSDANGQFQLAKVPAPSFKDRPDLGKSWWPYDLVVLAEGHGVAHVHLTAATQTQSLNLSLPTERLIKGQVVTPVGQPIAGAEIKVTTIGRIGQEEKQAQDDDRMLKLSWSSVPMNATSDRDGRFTFRGIPPEMQVFLFVRAARHATASFYYATTDQQPAPMIDTTIQSGQRTETPVPIRTGFLDVELQPTDHRLNGRVVFEDGGQPAAGVDVFRGQQRLGSTDGDGRFAIDDLSAGPFELHVSASNTPAAPLAVRVEMPATPQVVNRTFQLPKGSTIRGQVTDAATGKGVEGAEVRYNARLGPDDVWSFFGNDTRTDAEGRYHLVVPAGRGEVELFRLPPAYPPVPSRGVGNSAEPQFKREVAGATGSAVDASFVLESTPVLVLRAVDPALQPVIGAEARFMRGFDFTKVVGQTDAAGLIRLVGLDGARGTTVDLIQPVRQLGARLVIPPGTAKPPRELAFAPLVPVASRVLDATGQPLGGVKVLLYTDVEFPERSGMPVGETTTDSAGRFRFDSLIEGSEYYVQLKLDGYADASSPHILVKNGTAPLLAEFRLPATVQTLDGFVVDPRGNRLPNITVSVERDGSSPYSPSGHSFEDTDGRGEFHLNGLPDGELKVMAHRKPEGSDRSIKNLIKVKVQAGSKDVRIVLPDPNARLQGIED